MGAYAYKIPGWRLGPISTIAEINPKTQISHLSDDAEVSFFPMQNIGEDGQILKTEIKKLEEVRNGYTCFAEEDVLFAKITPCMENGKGALAQNLVNKVGFGSTEFHVLRAKENTSPEYLFHLTRSPKLRKQAERYMTGSAGQKRVSKNLFSNHKIPIPPFHEQQRIAEILNTVDIGIKESKKITDETTYLKQGMIKKLIIDGQWDIVPLKHAVTNFLNGGTPSTKNPEYWSNEIPWTTSAPLTTFYIDEGERQISQEGLNNSSSNLIPKNNVIIATRVGLGKVAVNRIDIAINQDLTGMIINKSKATPEYLVWYLLSPKSARWIKAIARGTTIKGITRNDLEKIKIPLPPLEKQQKITEILSTIDYKLELQKQKTLHLETLKRGLMNELLTGKRRVAV